MIHPEKWFRFQVLPELSQKERAVFAWRVPEDLPYFDGHFPQNPILPAIAVLDGTLQAFKLLTGEKMLSVQKIKMGKFLNIITPNTFLHISLSYQGKEWEAEWKAPETQKIYAHLKFSLTPAYVATGVPAISFFSEC